ncbi:MAG: hemerythrin domain-containing protein [Candidatus Rokubacteria bacterium]|nr:hemerythrin domain-containing protein [Candidatus Rokubacteria bacterium]
MTTPTETLRHEHVLILRALDVAEAAAATLERGDDPGDAFWTGLVGWLRGFADRNHHGKEEQALFPAMQKAGVPSEGGPIGVMLAEHVDGRAFIRAMELGGRQRAGAARGYVRLLRAHIEKENEVLFRIAEAVLDDRTQTQLAGRFEALAAELGAEASYGHAETALDKLAAQLTTTAR